jgi:hypothetical protein
MARKKETEDSAIVSAAKAIGEAAGKVAVLAGVTAPPPEPKKSLKIKIPKLAAKNKSRLPRRQKKANQKAAARAAK